MKVTSIFAILFASFVLTTVYLTQRQTSEHVIEGKSCFSIFTQTALLSQITYVENKCSTPMIFQVKITDPQNQVTIKTTDCIKPEKNQRVAAYTVDDSVSVQLIEQNEC